MTHKPYAWLWSVCLWGLVFRWVGVACPVPVYESAFTRWMPDDYLVTIEYGGELSGAPAKAVDALRAQSGDNSERANVRLEFRKAEGGERLDLPVMRVGYLKYIPPMVPVTRKEALGIAWTNQVWSGPLTEEAAARLLDSPARKEIKKRLLAGEVAVWVLLESGDRTKDDQAAQLAEATFKDIRASMKVPTPPVSPYADTPPPAVAGDKAVVLSLIRVSRGNPDEEFLATTMRQFLNDARGDRAPVLAPVFGRGMMLKPLYGKGLSAEAIRKVTASLLEHCTCTCPLPNQARNLLMTGNWERGAAAK